LRRKRVQNDFPLAVDTAEDEYLPVEVQRLDLVFEMQFCLTDRVVSPHDADVAVDIDPWTLQERAAHISEIATYLFRLSEIVPESVPECSQRILELWLDGHTPSSILGDREIQATNLLTFT
jgi:hypothetical protein